MDSSNTESADSAEKSLYRVGGVAALIATVLFLSDIIVLTSGATAPTSASEWFTLLQNDRAAGLIQLFFSDLIGLGLVSLMVFALYVALRRVNGVYMALATALMFAGVAIIFATNPNYSLIYLSDQYAAASGEAQQAQRLAAGETMLASMQGTGLLVASLIAEGALVTICVIMLQGGPFGRRIAYLGIAAHGLDLAHAIVFLVAIPLINSDTALAIGTPLLVIGGTLQLIWYPLVARRLLQLGRSERKPLPQPA